MVLSSAGLWPLGLSIESARRESERVAESWAPSSCLRKKRAGPSSQAEVRLEERDVVAQRSVGTPRREPLDPTVDRLTWLPSKGRSPIFLQNNRTATTRRPAWAPTQALRRATTRPVPKTYTRRCALAQVGPSEQQRRHRLRHLSTRTTVSESATSMLNKT